MIIKLLMLGLLIFSIFVLIDWQARGKFFWEDEYKTVKLAELLSFSNFYNGKKVCTRGYYVETSQYSIIKVSLREDEFTRSAWVSLGSHEIITRIGRARAVAATICGQFASRRAGEFGNPAVWNHQITVEKYKTEGDPLEVTEGFINKTF